MIYWNQNFVSFKVHCKKKWNFLGTLHWFVVCNGKFLEFITNMLRNFLRRETYPKYVVFRIGPVQKILVIMICIHWLCKYDKKKNRICLDCCNTFCFFKNTNFQWIQHCVITWILMNPLIVKKHTLKETISWHIKSA